MTATAEQLATTGRGLPLGRVALAGLVATVLPLLLFGGVSVFVLAVAASVPTVVAWVPAVALGGVMLCSTVISMQHGVDRVIRRYAGWLAAVAILGEILVAGGQHYLAVGHDSMPRLDQPAWGAIIGGLPSLMGGLLIHIVAMVVAQARREAARAVEMAREADLAERARAAADAARRQAIAVEDERHQLNLARERDLTAAAEAKTAAVQRQIEAAEKLARIQVEQVELVGRASGEPGPRRLEAIGGTARRVTGVGRKSPVRDAAIRWLRAQHRAGRVLAEIGPTELAGAISANKETCKKGLPDWRAAVLAVAEVAG